MVTKLAMRAVFPKSARVKKKLLIMASHLGYYGGFIDNAPAMGDKNLEWNLCHECILKMLQTFPMLAAKLPRGLHPTDDKTKPCCDWAWKHEGDAMTGRTYFADGLGGWK